MDMPYVICGTGFSVQGDFSSRHASRGSPCRSKYDETSKVEFDV